MGKTTKEKKGSNKETGPNDVKPESERTKGEALKRERNVRSEHRQATQPQAQ